MTTISTIKEILSTKVYVETPIEKMSEVESLRESYGVDSLGFVELRVQCESAFGIEISDAEFTPENFATIDKLARLVESLQSTTARA
jgi:acyl carrier protein